jgi:hypothetical protein
MKKRKTKGSKSIKRKTERRMGKEGTKELKRKEKWKRRKRKARKKSRTMTRNEEEKLSEG